MMFTQTTQQLFSTSVVVVPGTGEEVLQQLWALPGVQEEIHVVLLPPSEGLTQELSGLVHVEISGSEEAQDVLILWDLYTEVKG